MKVAIYASYSDSNVLDDYVWFAVSQLAEISDLVIMVVAGSTAIVMPSRCPSNIVCLTRENTGWDFASYRLGIAKLDLQRTDRLILCNDSVYGPFYPLRNMVNEMEKRGVDFWGQTQSTEVTPHLQSYFLCFDTNVLRSSSFSTFWDTLPVDFSRRRAIREGELKLTSNLVRAGFRAEAYCDVKIYQANVSFEKKLRRIALTLNRRWLDWTMYLDLWKLLSGRAKIGINPSLVYWVELFCEQNSPFIKKSLFRDGGETYCLADVYASTKESTLEEAWIVAFRHIEKGVA